MKSGASSESRLRELTERWQAVAIRQPGCQPYTNERPCRIRAHEDGFAFLELLEKRFPGKLSQTEWEEVFTSGLLLDRDGQKVGDPRHTVRSGQEYVRLLPGWVEPAVGVGLEVVYEDEVLLILDKPAPLPMHEAGRFFKNTLKAFMAEAWPELGVRYTHRLDAETSGLLVCVKGEEHRNAIQSQFEDGAVRKSYLATVQGYPQWSEKLVEIPIPRDGRPTGKRVEARTEFRVLARNSDGSARLEAIPLTGRTHQIRAHLWHEGFPIIGDGLYLPAQKLGDVAMAEKGSAPLQLRSWKVALRHPTTRELLEFEVAERSARKLL